MESKRETKKIYSSGRKMFASLVSPRTFFRRKVNLLEKWRPQTAAQHYICWMAHSKIDMTSRFAYSSMQDSDGTTTVDRRNGVVKEEHYL